MAVSPLIPRSPLSGSVATSTASKAKSLAVRSGIQAAPESPLNSATAASELAEQLNDHVRHKYVKGVKLFLTSASVFTTY